MRWRENPGIPHAVGAALDALQFSGDHAIRLEDAPWEEALAFLDRAHLTLPLGQACGASLPERIRQRIAANLAANRERVARLKRAYGEVADALARAGV